MITSTFRSYWLLAEALCFPFRWLKWLMAAGMFLLVIGLLASRIWGGPVLAAIGGAIVTLNLFMIYFFLPNQMLSLNSSKQIRLLGNIRLKSFSIFVGLSLMAPIAAVLFLLFTGNPNWLALSISGFLFLSTIVLSSMLVALRWPFAQGLIYASMGLMPKIFSWIMLLNSLFVAITIFLLWVCFGCWWLKWRPDKFHKNLFAMSPKDTLKKQQDWSLFFNKNVLRSFGSTPKTLIGTLLLGSADSWQDRVRRAVSGLFWIAAGLVVFRIALGGSAFNKILSYSAYVYIFVAYTSSNNATLGHIFNNLHKIWMFDPKSRTDLFSSLEKYHYIWVGVIAVPVAMVHFSASFFVSDIVRDSFFAMLLALFGALVLAFQFYIGLIIYCKANASTLLSAWARVGITLLGVLAVVICGSHWVDHKKQVLPFALTSMTTFAIGIFFLRRWVKDLWQRVDIVRVRV